MKVKLTDVSEMPFGKYKGQKMESVPASYLHYLWCNGLRNENSPLAEYVTDNLSALELEHPDGIWR